MFCGVAATLLVFEDVHWADEGTLDLLKFIGRRINKLNSLLVITYRDDEVQAEHPLRLVLSDLPRSSLRRVARIVHHAAASGDASAVIEYAPRAARQAAALHAHRESASPYQTALQYAGLLSSQQRAELLEHQENLRNAAALCAFA